MYSKELEAIIEAALADGVLTDKEREVLHRRAAQEGVDADELDVIIEGKLAKMKQEKDRLRPTPPATEKRGNIVKCPNCGAPVSNMSASCPECGHEFKNVIVATSVKDFFNRIIEIESNRDDDNSNRIFNQASSLIKAYPIPSSKEDIIEFLSMATTYMSDTKKGKGRYGWLGIGILLILIGLPLLLLEGAGLFVIGIGGYLIYKNFYVPTTNNYEKKLAKVWKMKCNQVITKARIILADDANAIDFIYNFASKWGIEIE